MKVLKFLIFLLFQNIWAQSYTVSGIVKDLETGETLPYTDVFEPKQSKWTTTDKNGYYSIFLPQSNNNLSFHHTGYEEKTINLNIEKDSLINVFLLPKAEQLSEVIIDAKKQLHHQSLLGKMTVTQSSIEKMPTNFGEVDLLKSLSLLPGVSSGQEGFSNIYVRGGDRGQNLILLDGIKIYNSNHIGGLVSLFNSDIIKQVDIYKGGFPSQYGGRISSVIDILTIDGNKDKIKGTFKLGLLSSGISLKGPLWSKTNFYLAVRSSYYDLFTLSKRKYYRKTGKGEYWGYTFYDINSKITHQFNPHHKISFSFYMGQDFEKSVFSSSKISYDNNKMRINNYGIGIQSFYRKNTLTSFQNTLSFSHYDNAFYSDILYQNTHTLISTKSQIEDFTFQSKMNYLHKNHQISTGIEVVYNAMQPGYQDNQIFDLYNDDYTKSKTVFNNMSAWHFSFFTEDEFYLHQNLRMNYGLRLNNSLTKSRNFWYLEPRFSISWKMNDNLSLKTNYTIMHQPNHLIVNNFEGFENELWFASSEKTQPQKAYQVSAGMVYTPQKSKLNYTLDVYYKKMKNLIEFSLPIDVNQEISEIENMIKVNGIGKSYGIEGQVSKSALKWNWTLNYTFSKSQRTFNEINKGRSYPFIYDRPHNFNFISSYKLSKKYALHSTFILQSGKPITLPVAYVPENEMIPGYFIYDGVNNRRLPTYHRLDISLDKTTISKKGREESLKINIFNVYARQNPSHIYIDESNGKVMQIAHFSIIPSLSYSIKF